MVSRLSQSVRQTIAAYCGCASPARVAVVQPGPTPPKGSAGLKAKAKTMRVGTRKKTRSQPKEGRVTSHSPPPAGLHESSPTRSGGGPVSCSSDSL